MLTSRYRLVRTGGHLAFSLLMLLSVRRTKWILNRKQIPSSEISCHPSAPVGEDEIELCRRIIEAYGHARSARGTEGEEGIWAWIFDARQEQLATVLDEGDAAELAELMASMFDKDFVLGMAAGPLLRQTSRNRLSARAWEVKCLDGLASLAEVVGVVPVEALEQGRAALAFQDGLEELVTAIEKQLGFGIGFPKVGAAGGLMVANRLITPDTPDQIYAALRLGDAIDLHLKTDSGESNLLEIGGGYGGMCYWFLQRNPSTSAYTIVDLPIVNVLQAYFLGKALGPDRVSLFGEPPSVVRILPDFALNATEGPVDVVANKDSFPEMPLETMQNYLGWISSTCTGFLYSYNQETGMEFMGERQGIVHRAATDLDGLERVRRDRAWLREGYVEEIYLATGGR
jgi:hypothetical protein